MNHKNMFKKLIAEELDFRDPQSKSPFRHTVGWPL